MPEFNSSQNLKEILSKFNFQFHKGLGQNFLLDGNIIRKIINSANLSDDDVVIEIGPGAGTLTSVLAKCVRRVIAVELDSRLSPILKETLAGIDNVDLVFEDALKLDYDKLIDFKCKDLTINSQRTYKLVSNLPYSITTPILTYLLRKKFKFSSLTLMVQREVSSRLIAVPGSRDYGNLSVIVQYYTVPEVLFIVPRAVFYPRPEVESAVVFLVKRQAPPVKVPEEDLFFSLVRGAFGQRRKTILNALSGGNLIPRLNRQQWQEIIQSAGIDPCRRGETLNLKEFSDICCRCWEYKH
jgi:16S rRNA (adenine1518-N6/adenine1519-N6)-dimethyltransferase